MCVVKLVASLRQGAVSLQCSEIRWDVTQARWFFHFPHLSAPQIRLRGDGQAFAHLMNNGDIFSLNALQLTFVVGESVRLEPNNMELIWEKIKI